MLCSYCVNVKVVSARLLGLGILLAALPLSVSASIVTVDFSISLNSLTGTGQFSYNTADINTGLPHPGPYTDAADGLDSLSLTYKGTTYTNAVVTGPSFTAGDLLDGSTLPVVFLPGNSSIDDGLQYEAEALWVVSGTCTATAPPGSYTCADATILALSRTYPAFLASDVSSVTVSNSGNDIAGVLGSPPGLSVITGSITSEAVVPEPTLLPLVAFGLAGLWFARRRKAVV
jgi:hypothetical protein